MDTSEDDDRTRRALTTTTDDLNAGDALFEDAPVGLAQISPEGVLVRVNAAFCALIGYEREALIERGITLCTLTAEEDRSRERAQFLELLDGGEGVRKLEQRYVSASGEPVWVNVSISLVRSEAGQTRYFLCAVTDISERKRWEQALTVLTARLQASNAELEQFAYVASHDLRQPLRMIRSYVQMLERRLDDKLDDETRQMMRFTSDGATRLDEMLVSLLEYSRVGRKGEPMAEIDSEGAVMEALRFLEPSIREADAEVRVRGRWPRLVASRDEFTRLFQNLIGNAVKYRAPDRKPEIRVEVHADDGGWRFSVADNGIGIDPAQFDRLFRVFQRLHARDKYEGSGIGLAVSRKIVERHGGHIWVESEGPDQGTRFCFFLPARQPANPVGE